MRVYATSCACIGTSSKQCFCVTVSNVEPSSRDWTSTSTVSTSTNTWYLKILLWTFTQAILLKYICTEYWYLVQMYLSTSTKYNCTFDYQYQVLMYWKVILKKNCMNSSLTLQYFHLFLDFRFAIILRSMMKMRIFWFIWLSYVLDGYQLNLLIVHHDHYG